MNTTKYGQSKKACAMFERALRIRPKDFMILTNYGRALVELGQPEAAFEKFEQALAIRPDDSMTLNNYGMALADHGQPEKACEVFERSLEVEPDDTVALNAYGKVLAKMGQPQRSFEMFERSLRVNRDDAVTLTGYGKALASYGRMPKALEMLERSYQIDPGDTVTLNSYGMILADYGQPDKAFEKFDRSLQINSDNIVTLTGYGTALANYDHVEKAFEMFERALQLDSDNVVTLTSYGTALAKQERTEEAREILERALQIKSDDPVTLFFYAALLEGSGEYEAAISRIKQIDRDKLPRHLSTFFCLILGRLHYLTQNENKGSKYFEMAIENSPSANVGRIRAARNILIAKPYSEDAVELLRQITTDSPGYDQATQLLSLNLTPQAYFEMFRGGVKSKLKDTNMLNQAMYHKVKNELGILKGIVYRIIATDQSQEAVLAGTIQNIENILDEIAKRREEEQDKVTKIPTDDYQKRLEVISQTAHDISDLVNNEMAVIESQVRRSLLRLSESDPLYQKFIALLDQIERTQGALDDLKSISEGIKINYQTFEVQELFGTWRTTLGFRQAAISLDIQNGLSEFVGDEPKIRGFVNELVENSLNHNPDKDDLHIRIMAKDVDGLPPHVTGLAERRERRVPGERKYLAITVSDNGRGIPPDQKEWIFLPLTTTSASSSGLGLFIIKKTLKQMDGYIVENGTQGANFEIYIPHRNGGEK